jgi:hypothetical protein
LLPTKLNDQLEPHIGKDFKMDVVEKDQTLEIILTRKKKRLEKQRKVLKLG